SLTGLVLNSVIGSGIFGLPSVVAGLLGRAGIYAYFIAAVGIGVIMGCFAEVVPVSRGRRTVPLCARGLRAADGDPDGMAGVAGATHRICCCGKSLHRLSRRVLAAGERATAASRGAYGSRRHPRGGELPRRRARRGSQQ